MQNITKNLEGNFLNNLREHFLALQVGTKHSGKTVFSCCLLRHLLLKDNFYDEFHLVLPSYSNQAKGTFDWLDKLPPKAKNKIIIYEAFSMVIIDNLIDSSNGKTNRFLYVDDATSEQSFFQNSEQLKALSTRCRHLKISCLLCFHYLRRSLTPQLRNSCEFLILHRCCDEKLLTNVWEETISLFMTKEEFLSICKEEMIKDFPCIVIWKDKVKIDTEAMMWNIQKIHRPHIIKVKSTSSNLYNIRKPQNASSENQKCSDEIDRSSNKPESNRPKHDLPKNKGIKNFSAFAQSCIR
jgi:hypothetical protein